MINDTNLYFDSIHIEKFGNLQNVCLEKARKFNFIYSGINSGKTTFLEAVKVMLCPVSECRIFNYYKQKYDRKGYFYFKNFLSFSGRTELFWSAQDLKFYDRLIGSFNNDKFAGYGYYQFGNDNLKIKKFDGTVFNFGDEQTAFSEIGTFTGKEYSFYDCLSWKSKTDFSDDGNPYMKDYILDFMGMYNEDVTDISLKDGIFYVKNNKSGEMPAYNLGDFIYSAIVFYKFIAGCKSSVILIDNFDCMLNSLCTEAYVEMFLGIVNKLSDKNAQFFITVKDVRTLESFLNALYRNKRQEEMSLICLDKKSKKELSELGFDENRFYKKVVLPDDLWAAENKK